jgi:hypothetical protein
MTAEEHEPSLAPSRTPLHTSSSKATTTNKENYKTHAQGNFKDINDVEMESVLPNWTSLMSLPLRERGNGHSADLPLGIFIKDESPPETSSSPFISSPQSDEASLGQHWSKTPPKRLPRGPPVLHAPLQSGLCKPAKRRKGMRLPGHHFSATIKRLPGAQSTDAQKDVTSGPFNRPARSAIPIRNEQNLGKI